MKGKVVFIQVIAGLCLVVFGIVSLMIKPGGSQAARVATLIEMKGTVELQPGGKTAWIQARENQAIYENDTVRTRGGSKVAIRFDDGTVTKMGSLAIMHFTSMKRSGDANQTELSVNTGKAWLRVNKLASPDSSFAVATPSAVAGVRGTYFSAEVDQSESSTFDVFEGSVEVKSKADPTQAVLVGRDERTVVPKGKPAAPPTTIPSDQLNSLGNELSEKDFDKYQYDIVAVIDPQQLKPGETANLSLQLMKGGAPVERAVTYDITLSGAAKFVKNGESTIQVQSDPAGAAELQITSSQEEAINVSVSVSFDMKNDK